MFISFLFLSEERRKKRTKERRKKRVLTQWKTFAQKARAKVYGAKGCKCDHFYKNARKTLAFSGCFIRFTLDLMLQGVAGATRQYFMYDKIRSCFLSEFSVCRSVLPRSFFLLFGSFFFFLLRKKEEKRTKKKYYKLQQIIRLNQKIKICN